MERWIKTIYLKNSSSLRGVENMNVCEVFNTYTTIVLQNIFPV